MVDVVVVEDIIGSRVALLAPPMLEDMMTPRIHLGSAVFT